MCTEWCLSLIHISFHNEKTPSFTVSPDKKIAHCFGSVSYTHLQSGVKKSEAIKNIAKEFGINKKEVYSFYHEKYD